MTCCERLHTSANIAQQETTLLGPTMLRVVASVCTGLKVIVFFFFFFFFFIIIFFFLGHSWFFQYCLYNDKFSARLKLYTFKWSPHPLWVDAIRNEISLQVAP